MAAKGRGQVRDRGEKGEMKMNMNARKKTIEVANKEAKEE